MNRHIKPQTVILLQWVAIIALLLFAFALRAHLLGAQSLWHDEGNSYVQATRPLDEIAANAARDIHPPLYYWMLAIWRGVAGESEFALRFPSAFASLITVALTYAIGRRLFAPMAGFAAAVFITLNTFSIYYAQETRMYALLGLWAAASIFALILFFERPSKSRALALAIINALGLWTQYSFPFVMIAQGIAALAWMLNHHQRQTLRVLGLYIAANLLTIALYLPWLPTALTQVTSWTNTGNPMPMAEALHIILSWFAFGITAQTIPLSIVVIVLAVGLLTFNYKPQWAWWRMSLIILLAVVPTGIFLALGLFREANLKFLITAQIGFALWLGRGVWILYDLPRIIKMRRATVKHERITELAPKLAAIACVLWLITNQWGGIDSIYHDDAYQRADYRAIAAQLSAEATAADAIILNAPNQEEVFNYYYHGVTPVYALPRGLGGDDAATRAEVEQILADHPRVFVIFWGEAERDPNRMVEVTLDQNAYEVDNVWVSDVRIARYAAPRDLPITHASQAIFGDSIALREFRLNADSLRAGDALQVQFAWQALQPIPARYNVFVQLLNPDGTLALQRDSEPVGGTGITSDWQVEQPITDNHALFIPADLPSGEYGLIVGFYDTAAPYGRLSVSGGETNAEADALILTTITVE